MRGQNVTKYKRLFSSWFRRILTRLTMEHSVHRANSTSIYWRTTSASTYTARLSVLHGVSVHILHSSWPVIMFSQTYPYTSNIVSHLIQPELEHCHSLSQFSVHTRTKFSSAPLISVYHFVLPRSFNTPLAFLM